MRWNLRLKAAEQGIWKSTEMRRRLAEAGVSISHGKMSALWTGTPISIRLDDLEAMCQVLDCTPADLLIAEERELTATSDAVSDGDTDTQPQVPRPHLGRNRTLPPA